MTILVYIAAFLLFCILQALFINGVHIAMDGKEVLDKDGNIKGQGEVLYPLVREFRKATITKVYLSVDAVNKAIEFCQSKYAVKFPAVRIVSFNNIGAIEYAPQDKQSMIPFLEQMKINEAIKYVNLDEVMLAEKKEGMNYFVFEKVETVYKYNYFIRKSIFISCIKCGSSFWGLITFVPLFIYLEGLRWEILPLAIFNILTLVFLNVYFYKQ